MLPTDHRVTIKIAVGAVREFNRVYTRQLGRLDSGLHGSQFTLTEARLLYELAASNGITATELGRDLGIDMGYLSRLLAKFERRGLVKRRRSNLDARQSSIRLTHKGRTEFEPLNQAARHQVKSMIQPMTAQELQELLSAMRCVEQRLKPELDKVTGSTFSLRSLRIGDIGWITHRQAILYSEEYGWDGTYGALVAEILGQFVRHFDPKWEYGWVAHLHDRIVGSVFLVRASATVAKLRLLYVEPTARGLGIGKRLVHECINLVRSKGYQTLTLWTNDVFTAARRIYEAAGFQLTKEEQHHSFGKDLVGQTWDLTL